MPVRIAQPHRGRSPLNWGEVWRYRELLYFLAWRDVKIRYKQTVFGFAWAIAQPVAQMVVFSAIFGGFLKVQSEGYPYPLYVFAGLLPWQFFSQALTNSSMSVVSNAGLVTKVYFPRLIIPLASAGGTIFNFAISFLVMAGMMIAYRVPVAWTCLMVLPLSALTLLTALGFGMILSVFTTAFRDVRNLMPFLVNIWLYLTPVIYPVTVVPERFRWIVSLNPMAGIVDGFRWALLGKPLPLHELLVSVAVTLLVCLVACEIFGRLEKRFADIV